MNNDARRHDNVAAGNRRLNGIPARRSRDVRDVRDTSEIRPCEMTRQRGDLMSLPVNHLDMIRRFKKQKL